MKNNRQSVFLLFPIQKIFFVFVSIVMLSSINSFGNNPSDLKISQIEAMTDDSNKVNYLIKECENHPNNSSANQQHLINLLLETSTLLHQNVGIIQANIFLSDYYSAKEQNDSALIYIRTSKRRSLEYHINTFLFEIYLKEAIIHGARNDVAGEKESLKRAKLFSKEQGNTSNLAQVYQLTAEYDIRFNRLYSAIVHLEKAINIFKRQNDTQNLIQTTSILSDVYLYKKEYSLVINTLTEANLEITTIPARDSLVGHMYTNLGLAWYHLGNKHESRIQFEKAENRMPKPNQCLIIYDYLFLTNTKNKSKQLEYIDKLSEINNSTISEPAAILAKNKKIYFNSIGNCDSAIVYANKALEISQTLSERQLFNTIQRLELQNGVEYNRAELHIKTLESQFKTTKSEMSILIAFISFISFLSIIFSITYKNTLPTQYIRFSYYLLFLTVTINIGIHLFI